MKQNGAQHSTGPELRTHGKKQDASFQVIVLVSLSLRPGWKWRSIVMHPAVGLCPSGISASLDTAECFGNNAGSRSDTEVRRG